MYELKRAIEEVIYAKTVLELASAVLKLKEAYESVKDRL